MFEQELAATLESLRTARDVLADTAAALREINDALEREVNR